MIVTSNAKLSLALKAIPLDSEQAQPQIEVFSIPLTLRDTIEILTSKGNPTNVVFYANPTTKVKEKATIDKTLNMMQAHFKYDQTFFIRIYKIVPSEVGLGGGSGNAAQVMLSIVKLLKLKTNIEELLEIAKKIGSEVAISLLNSPAIVQYPSQKLNVIPFKIKTRVLLIIPSKTTNKEKINQEFIKDKKYSDFNLTNVIEAAQQTNLTTFGKTLFNDFDSYVIKEMPGLKTILEKLSQSNVECYGICGSGPIVFVLSNNIHLLRRLSSQFKKDGYQTINTEVHK